MSRGAPGVTGAATRGVLWSLAAGSASKVIAVASTLVLARLLVRQELGVAAYAVTFASLFEVLRGLGVGQALIFFPSEDRRMHTAFWLVLANGALLAALALVLAPVASIFFRDPRAAGVIRPLALYFPLLALGQVLDFQLRKDLRFGRRFGPELARSLVRAVVAVGLALLGWSYWSLIAAHVAGAAVWSAALWTRVPWRPRLVFDRSDAKLLLGYGKHLVAVSVLVVIATRADHLAVGRFFGPADLGVYAIAFTLPALLFQASSGLSLVLFPAYARLDRDRDRLRAAALRTLRLVAALFVPAGIGLGLVAEPLVMVVFGPEWRPAIGVLPWLGAWAALQSLTHHFGDVYKAIGEVRILAWLSAITTVLLLPGLLWAGRSGGGLVAIVAVLIAVRAVRLGLDLVVVRSLVGLHPGAALRAVAPALAGAAVMALAVIALDRSTAGLSDLPRLLLLAATGAAVHLGVLAAIDRGLYREVRALLQAASAKPAGVVGT
ncbi:MAG TPA: oligosaccharide flippase family protein [Thermoanaerobaculia bacterium]|nr:oligosaccharide flippase family protein [Thermoanaerobaculia bacterium]